MCIKHLNMSYGDIWNMPTYERRFFIDTFLKEIAKQKEEMDNISNKNARGSRTTKISGPRI